MSYDTNIMAISYNEKLVSIPLEQGNVLRLEAFCKVLDLEVSLNPFGTGQCLTTTCTQCVYQRISLNPFGTGQCLTT